MADADDPYVTRATTPTPVPSQQQRYTILRSHQQGGLGLVSIARDEDFNREVALKEILPSSADDEHNRRRFVREAEITGALEHPGVVPVYSLGLYEDGRPYYAMRFVHGVDMQQAIEAYNAMPSAEKPLRFRQLLGRFVDVCQTIHYAHSRGVLHRDLKPSNIMLGDYGETIVVDWGLAKASGEGHSVDDMIAPPVTPSGQTPVDKTVAGRVIGTPIYMSPEQAEGRLDRFGVPTDVYGLGATLYHLLCGSPPFDPNNANVLGDARIGAFILPQERTPGVPKPLAVICSKAMAKQPADRYQTAGELGLEVERYLADEPVAAYREPISARSWRWIRGHRTLVLSLMTSAAVAVVALSLGVVLLSAANKQVSLAKDRADANFHEAVAERNRAEKNAALARQAVRDYYVRVSEETLLSQPGMQPLRNDLLGQAMTYYQQFLEESQDDPELRSEVAEAQFYLGNITEVISGPAPAIPHYQSALDIQGKQAESPDATDEAGIAYARSLNAMGRAYQKLQRPDQAFEFYERAVAIRQTLAEAQPDSPERARELASSVMNIGLLFASHGSTEEAVGYLRRAQTIRLAHVGDDDGAITPLRKDLGMGYFNLAQVLLGRQDALGAAEQLRLAITEFEAVEVAEPNDIANESRLANCRRALADVSAAMNEIDDAILEYQAAAKLMTRLVVRNPEAPAYALDLAGVRMNLGGLLRSIDRSEEALQEMLAAVELLTTPEGEPSSPRQRRDLGVAQREAGLLLILLDKKEEGLERLSSSRQVFKSLVREHPGQQDFSSELSKTNGAIHEAETEKESQPTEKAA
jgi:serine/threonine-protein kinase